MCFSAKVRAQLKEVAREFDAKVDLDAFETFFRMRLKHPEFKLPLSIDRYFVLSKDPAEARLARFVTEFHRDEKDRLGAELDAVEAELKELGGGKPTAAARKKIEVRERKLVKLARKRDAGLEDLSPLDDRIFPFYYAPVVALGKTERKLVPMRYRVRRPDGGEVPGQYNVFNARYDSLTEARTWKPLFGKHHAIFPFVRFYEWVERDGGKAEIYFAPEQRALMWAASLYGVAKGAEGPLLSFAMVTDDPPPEVAAAGHDRCPVFLRRNEIESWLHPSQKSPEELLALLRHKEKTFYLNGLAA